MPNFSGLSFSIVGNIKNLKPFTSSLVPGNEAKESEISIIDRQIKESISIKPLLIPYSQFLGYGFDSNLVGINTTLEPSTTEKPMSPTLINWAESFVISGMTKTLFYTEVNSGLKPGMRVFIINGNYDSDLLIKSDKYKRGRDGYKVLKVDKCQVLLDIDYTGVTPYLEQDIDNFVNLYYIDSQSDFDTINREITTKNDSIDYKFNFYKNNLIYTTSTFAPTVNGGPQFGVNGGITQSGFYVRDDNNQQNSGTYSWIDISNSFLSGSYSWALSPTFSTETRLKIHNGSFTLTNGSEFKEGVVYKWDIGPTQSMWIPDVRYLKPVISKTNFRDGNFEGTWNVGLYGSSNKKITWNGQKSTWNTGTLLNTKWLSGKMNSIHSLPESYMTELDGFGNPYQRINGPNNNGRGYNFILDSEIESAQIDNGSFYNTLLGTQGVTYSVVEEKILQSNPNYPIEVNRAYFEEPTFNNCKVLNSEVRRARSLNSTFDNVKAISSIMKQSVMTNSDWISDETVKILDYDEFNISESNNLSSTYSQISGATHKLYKFYINELDYTRIKRGDAIYFKNILIDDGLKNLTNFFDKKIILGTRFQYFDDFYDPNNPDFTSAPQIIGGGQVPTYSFYKRGVEVTTYLSTPSDNKWTISTQKDTFSNYWTGIEELNNKKLHSVDVYFSFYDRDGNFVSGLDFDVQTIPTTIYSSQTMLFTYSVSSTPYSQITPPAGLYDNKPYYILLNGTTNTPFSYVFFTASNNRWENWQFFNPITGDTALSDFYMSLTYSGVDIPDSSTEFWIQQVDTSQTIISSSPYSQTVTASQSIPKVIIDPKPGANSYILNDDFESGILERSNWNSGSNINFNADNNINNYSNIGGSYDLQVLTQSQSIIANVGLDNNFRETLDQFFEIGNVMFLNNVTYDTRGKITSIGLTNSGTGYVTSTETLSGGSGTQSTVQITANPIGGVEIGDVTITGAVSFPSLPYTYLNGTWTGQPTSAVTGSGLGLTFDFTISGGTFQNLIVNNPGIGYTASDVVQILGAASISPVSVTIQSVLNGEIISATVSNGGVQYVTGEVLTIDGGLNGQVTVVSTTGSTSVLPEAYKITGVLNNQITLKEIITNTSSISNLLSGGISYNDGIENRWGYLHPLKINESLIKSGLLKRTYLYNSLIKNDDLNLLDKDFNNQNDIRKLINLEILFSNNSNILSKAAYVDSHFSIGSDIWNDGLLFRSFWNSGTFSRGLVKETRWKDGVFESGLFYESRSFNELPSQNDQFYDSERILSNHKSGFTSDIVSNNRWSWQSGTFSSGEFLKSDWEQGEFLDGKFWNSKWYNGTFHYGTIGDKSIGISDTRFFSGLIKKSIVERAELFARDTSFLGLSQSQIVWQDGIFNDGVFGCDIINQPGSNHTAIWEKGKFNGGEFVTNGKWKNGFFNGGKFTSGFGWTYATTAQSQFGWESGQFNSGEFGVESGSTNSMWFTGEFNGGKFQGRVWNSGVFTSGDFVGGSTWSAVGGGNPDGMTTSNADFFVDSFTNSFWGLWKDGLVTNRKDEFIKDEKIFSNLQRALRQVENPTKANFRNMLWEGGTFSHSGGEFKNSIWLDGEFNRGRFLESSFNPYVKRSGQQFRSFNLEDDFATETGSCIWKGGTLEDSDFYVSQWISGKFISGTAIGMVWKNGISSYMNAYNIFWEDGTWRNGNWNGSYIVYNGSTLADFNQQILVRGMSYSGTSSTHFWNVFESGLGDVSVSTNMASQPVTFISQTPPIPPSNNFAPPIPSDIRLKKNIVKVSRIKGINIYHYEYIDLPNLVFKGVIAQELLGTKNEECLVCTSDGILMVDYNKLHIKFERVS